jgi:hypothetical protein
VRKTLVIISSTFSLAIMSAQTHLPMNAAEPPDPFIDYGACPFECCTYREWKAESNHPLYEKPHGRVIGTVKKDTTVQALTGETISRPVPFVYPQDSMTTSGIKKGEKVYLYHAEGEGSWIIWYRGKVMEDSIGSLFTGANGVKEFDEQVLKRDRTEWWAKVKLPDGRVGWVHAWGFDHQGCGE